MNKTRIILAVLALFRASAFGCQDPEIESAIEAGVIQVKNGVTVPVQQGILEEPINWSEELKRIQSDDILEPVAKVIPISLAQLRGHLTLTADLKKSRIRIVVDEKNLTDGRVYAQLLANEYSVFRVKHENDRLRRKTGLEVRLKLLKLEEDRALTILQGLHLDDDEEELEELEDEPRWLVQQRKWETLRSDRIKAEEELKEFRHRAKPKK